MDFLTRPASCRTPRVVRTGWIRHWCHSRSWPSSRHHHCLRLRLHRFHPRRLPLPSLDPERGFCWWHPLLLRYSRGIELLSDSWLILLLLRFWSSAGPSLSSDAEVVGHYHCDRCTSARIELLRHFPHSNSCRSDSDSFAFWASAPSPPHPFEKWKFYEELRLVNEIEIIPVWHERRRSAGVRKGFEAGGVALVIQSVWRLRIETSFLVLTPIQYYRRRTNFHRMAIDLLKEKGFVDPVRKPV